ncbi:MAG: hypothetical protein NTV63_04455 [Candidatus Woesearchaeota archaeon]|nr:hypothetical protein [Candidatus Woesearchaeota archaeon]
MLISPMEIIDIIVMSVLVGIIFSDFFKVPSAVREKYEPLTSDYRLKKRSIFGINKQGFISALLVTAPAIVLHEMGHKFSALAFGLSAVFHADYMWLMLGVILKFLHFPFLIFVPGYVEISGGTYLQNAITSFAGPAVNLILWLAPLLAVRKGWVNKRRIPFFIVTSRINMFLFIFNMLPIPPFDGFNFIINLWRAIF